jgi:ubiquinone/menaquinone biosynthesis C-methylase UbiE
MTTSSLNLDTPELAHTYENVCVDRQFRAGQQLLAALQLTPGAHVLDVGSAPDPTCASRWETPTD